MVYTGSSFGINYVCCRKSMALARMLEKTFESVVMTSLYPRAQIDILCEIIQVIT